MCLDNSRTHLLETFLCKAFPCPSRAFPSTLGKRFLHQSSLPCDIICTESAPLLDLGFLRAGLLGWYLYFQHLGQHITPFETVETMNEGIENLKAVLLQTFRPSPVVRNAFYATVWWCAHTVRNRSLFPVSLYTMHSDDFSVFSSLLINLIS